MRIGTNYGRWIADGTLGILCVLVLFLSYQHIWGNDSSKASTLHQGMKVSLPGVDWAKQSPTILLGISTVCQYCEASMPFYRKLADAVRPNGTRMIAVFPQPEADGANHLRQNNVTVDAVMGERLGQIGIYVTPTLALVNAKGVVTDVWVGRLKSEDEAAVIARLHGQGVPNNNRLDHVTLAQLKNSSPKLIVLDVRDRTLYRGDHYVGAVNIPADELSIRGPIELPRFENVVIDCRDNRVGICDSALRVLTTAGFTKVAIFEDGD